MVERAQTDIATLGKFVTLRSLPVEAKWSVTTIGKDDMFGPTDTTLWALVRYSPADFASVARALEADRAPQPVTVAALPAWLAAEVDLAQFRRGSDHVFEGSAGKPYASGVYSTGFALALPDQRVLIHFSSR
jgi:hypothetical protein